MNQPKRGFAIPPGMAELVGGAKVTTKEGEANTSTPPAEQKPPEAEKPPEEVKPPAEPEKTPPAPAEPAAHVHRRADDPAPEAPVVKKPWEVSTTEPTASNFKPELGLHAKMEWVCNNVPRMSRLRILREGAEMLCDALIAKYHKEE